MTRYPKHFIALAVIAAVSITINLLVLGSLAGERAGHSRHMERGLMRQMIGSVPPEVRPLLRDELRERRDDLRGNFRAMREARREVSTALGAEPFSDAALRDALAALRLQTDTAQALIHAAMADTADVLTAERRLAWAERQWRRRRLPSEDMVEAQRAGEDASVEAEQARQPGG
ncbi:periplasmic heavy metal sensor [Polycyclovorans algicola]|uniref:periplasmic heavy metal sensor n=1 Tax=Polycyclovorans algicola TaxID=616992 RepID=UPI0004A6C9C4|nr:periplasmic heavy metal sensor [Polycyclovorans algicola]